MERMNFVKNGVCRLPPGFRFQPTDEELVFQYLKCKVLSCPLPTSIIPEINVCNYDPWDLPGNCEEQERYFFSYKEAKYRNGNRMNRNTKPGHWKATGSEKKISSPTNNNKNNNCSFSGVRKTLVFYEGKTPNGFRTNWVMHEYRLVIAETSGHNSTHLNHGSEVGDWVLCRISMKTRSEGSEVGERRLFYFTRELHYSDPSSSCSSSSDITEVVSRVADHEETSACSNYNLDF
ncbi:NAC domain-containing protein 83-like isoform X1 [Prosopis cineraria]|uniref:NAC domain-containing protein 83-like isoform X1 n=1 Tax=Prosopis cineraria TaxID=364024 RepID=UPI00240ED3FF|nr:NAC domain-containing protein 83-like isoform X1 [Prosopis cineraria]